MELFEVLFHVAIIWIIAAITPGPNFFVTVHTAIGDMQSSFYNVAGIVTGTFIWSTSGFLGISVLFKAVPMIYYSLKIIGGIYLLYMGVSLLLNRKRSKKDYRIIAGPSSPLSYFKLGLLTNLLNPKTAAFMASLFAATIPSDAPLETGIFCVLIICLISACWYSFVTVIFSYDRTQKAYVDYRILIERVAGLIFIYFGIKLAATE